MIKARFVIVLIVRGSRRAMAPTRYPSHAIAETNYRHGILAAIANEKRALVGRKGQCIGVGSSQGASIRVDVHRSSDIERFDQLIVRRIEGRDLVGAAQRGIKTGTVAIRNERDWLALYGHS